MLEEFSKQKGVEVRCKGCGISQRRREGKKEREAMIVTTIKEEGVWREREAKVVVTWKGLERKKGWGCDKHQKGSGLKREVMGKKERKR